MGTAIVSCKIPGTEKQYELVVSTYQMCILYLFNHFQELSIDEIREHMDFDIETAKKNVQSLMTNNGKILIMVNGKFKVNLLFQNKLRRINLPIPVLEEIVKKERITQDRSHAVDACIVRIMKSRKKVTYSSLRLEVVTLMQNFKPDEVLIKKRIESLIEREYIMKDKSDENILLQKP